MLYGVLEIEKLNLKLDLSGRVAIVTGGAAGIGRTTALSVARHRAAPSPVCDTEIMNTNLAKAVNREAVTQGMLDISPLVKALYRMIAPDEVV